MQNCEDEIQIWVRRPAGAEHAGNLGSEKQQLHELALAKYVRGVRETLHEVRRIFHHRPC
jgi:hypothetical protein